MTETSRERRLEFIADFGKRSLEVGATEMLAMYGPDWLTDEQILDITRDKIDGWRRGMRQAIRNRAIQKARVSGETGMVLGTGKERPLSIGLHTDGYPEARFESASLHQD